MDDIRTALKLVQKNGFMCKIDLKNAYYSVPIDPDFRKYLRFCFDNTSYQFTCLPFGLSTSPLAFTKLTKPVIAWFHRKNISCMVYLDDFLILDKSAENCEHKTRFMVDVFYALKCFVRSQRSCNILLRVDNTTAISYINRMGSVKYPNLSNLARTIWQWCEERDVWISAFYIKSLDNNIADERSRAVHKETEWELSNDIYCQIVELIQTLVSIKVDSFLMSPSHIQIFITDNIKTSLTNREQPCLQVPFFREKPGLCAASLLMEYIDRTSSLRSHAQDYLFLTTRKPHKTASTQSVSRWIRCTLAEAGINTKVFSAYSTRHAATSAAYRNGIMLETIRKTAGWTARSETFRKFYNRPVNNNLSFPNSILGRN
ncbi:hypothetical protein NQ315_003492 [Exocentrus adspersus]|uniref:Reverse transcriptase domain-containing protein n=1 Tax=Exocentrus adspersus TaxID=1586481 RepID=A0AAV8V3H7_9CUCU|nr:hypothetical protein NQ315_003492 [Exocentrus adspersus]